jgi:polyisoprenoid-binding protein YceI
MSGSRTILAGRTLAAIRPGIWRIDPMHSAVTFAVRHLMSRVRGSFNDFDGQLRVASELPGPWSVEASIAMASVDTGTPMRDEDLRSENFFDAARFPSMRFVSTEVAQHPSGFTVVGDLTIRDITQQVAIEVEFLGVDESGLQGEPRIGFSGRASVRRSDFGVGASPVQGSKVVIGDVVTIELDVEAYLELK